MKKATRQYVKSTISLLMFPINQMKNLTMEVDIIYLSNLNMIGVYNFNLNTALHVNGKKQGKKKYINK